MSENTVTKPQIMLNRLLADFAYVAQEQNRMISGVCTDSRAVEAGDVFLAVRGLRSHGRDYVDLAVSNGAAAVVLDIDTGEAVDLQLDVPLVVVENLFKYVAQIAARCYDYPAAKMKLTGITGTNGKTSVGYFLAQALHGLGKQSAMLGTIGNGLWQSLRPSNLTTPFADSLQKQLYDFVGQQVEYAAMEVSSHALDQGRVDEVAFTLAVFTNLSHDHLDYHGDMDAYGRAKQKLFACNSLQAAVLNADDDFGKRLLKSTHVPQRLISYSTQGKRLGDLEFVNGEIVARSSHGMTVSIHSSWGEAQLQLALVGEFNLHNLLAVMACLCVFDFEFEKICEVVQTLVPPPGRMEMFQVSMKPVVLVDYAHTPDALRKALQAMREHSAKQLWVVVGCGGDRDRSKRPVMASIAESLADYVVLTDDNPRTEDPHQIMNDMLAGLSNKNAARILHDREKAIAYAIRSARHDDMVLVAGKGHEDYQIIGEQKRYFSDRDTVTRLLKEAA